MSAKTRTIRCAVYTRKFSEDGLEQTFNSLDAQGESCAAFVASQKHEGWKLLPGRCGDGGLSGGTLERPALQRLLTEVDAGRVDMVVFYKIDRLTRSLMDFAKLVERLDKANCSFVSVTQAFNTSTSMGRLTLNVLLSFAQFEREVTAERIRDKIAASKKKGMWMGGLVPLGYDPHPDTEIRSLVVNPIEAETVTALFQLYDTLGALGAVAREADRLRLRSKRRIDKNGYETGDHRLSNGQIHHLLRNPLYIGQIRHKDQLWPGQHPPIVSHDLWTRVQIRLDAASRRGRSQSTSGNPPTAMLTGKLRDECGDRLTPTHSVKGTRRHRYYVSNRLIAGGVDPTGWRLPAGGLEQSIAASLADHLQTQAQTHALLSEPDASLAEALLARVMLLTDQLRAHPVEAAALIIEVRLTRTSLRITCDADPLADRVGVRSDNLAPATLAFNAPFSLRRRGVETRIVSGALTAARDPTLLKNLAAAHRWTRSLLAGTPISAIIRESGHAESHIRTRSQLAFLSPRLQAGILAGNLSPDLTLKRLLARVLPLDWDEQEKLCGLPPL